MDVSSETDSGEIKLYPEVQPKKVKRYNAGLYKNYDTYRDKLCFRTISKWDTLGQKQHITSEKVNDQTELQRNTYDNRSTAKNGKIVESKSSCNNDDVNHIQLKYSEHDCNNLENINDITCDEINHSFVDDQNSKSNSDENGSSDSESIRYLKNNFSLGFTVMFS
ncbi:PREDICTED: GATA zinc finger domain-containing protein 24-like [Vollenhovia emeryi]|uniref:GATA zinc finger domain-containing protein 24-like n=1 Tax=Vollenhovia emeryi TaxID=411798 RepID=UPI0005F48A77|nr:PREDICTED: GATA zinc finger domain-containing protein 24-like [Vollenhovia emeryi]